MPTSWLALLVAIYVSLDVANPFMPGALTFGVESSIEARQADRFRGHDDAVGSLAATPTPKHGERVELRESRAPSPPPETVRVWHRPVRHAVTASSTPATPSDDH